MLENIGFFELSALSVVIPIIYSLFYIKKLSFPIKLILCFLIFSFIIDILNFTIAFNAGINSDLINIYSIGQTLLCGFYFFLIPTNSKLFKNIHLLVVFVFLIAEILTQIFITFSPRFNIYAVCLSSFGIILHSVFYLFDMIRNNREADLQGDPFFTINSSLFIYHSCVFTIFLTFEILEIDLKKEIWNIKLLAYIILNLVIFISIRMNLRSLKNV